MWRQVPSWTNFYAKSKKEYKLEKYLYTRVDQDARWLPRIRELRIETGRWERRSVGGHQVCKLCGVELEDAEHVMLRCGEYAEERRGLKEAGKIRKESRADRCLDPTGVVGVDHGRRWRGGRHATASRYHEEKSGIDEGARNFVSGMRM